MKQFSIFVLSLLFIFSFSIGAETAVLIDFSTLAADYPQGEPAENSATMIDFSGKAGTVFTEEEKVRMKTSLALNNWEVLLAPSSRTIENQTLSLTKQVTVKESASQYASENVLGVRVHFPTEPFNSWAVIRPPFEIPAYMKKTEVQGDGSLVEDQADMNGSKFNNYGVVKNVGVLKSVSVNVLGMNYQNGFELIFKDHRSEEFSVFMNYLDFDGWKTITWNNPNYVTQVRNREIQRYPLYPNAAPMLKLIGIRVSRDASKAGGDFITYVKDVNITYDKAVITVERDIDDEAVWGILDEREKSRRNAEFSKLGNIQVLRYLEEKKMHKDGDVATTPSAPAEQ